MPNSMPSSNPSGRLRRTTSRTAEIASRRSGGRAAMYSSGLWAVLLTIGAVLLRFGRPNGSGCLPRPLRRARGECGSRVRAVSGSKPRRTRNMPIRCTALRSSGIGRPRRCRSSAASARSSSEAGKPVIVERPARPAPQPRSSSMTRAGTPRWRSSASTMRRPRGECRSRCSAHQRANARSSRYPSAARRSTWCAPPPRPRRRHDAGAAPAPSACAAARPGSGRRSPWRPPRPAAAVAWQNGVRRSRRRIPVARHVPAQHLLGHCPTDKPRRVPAGRRRQRADGPGIVEPDHVPGVDHAAVPHRQADVAPIAPDAVHRSAAGVEDVCAGGRRRVRVVRLEVVEGGRLGGAGRALQLDGVRSLVGVFDEGQAAEGVIGVAALGSRPGDGSLCLLGRGRLAGATRLR